MNMDGNISVALVAGVVDPTIIDITNRILFPSNLPLRDISGSHPFSAAAFFDRAVSVFVDTMLGFDMKRGISKPEGGILGYITNFFAAAETTKAGDLHAHFLIWVRGLPTTSVTLKAALQTESFRRQLCKFQDAIATAVPPVFLDYYDFNGRALRADSSVLLF
ncbi:hypothetical protein BC829DRAFT_443152 [Chytridium lagenaria]|nr:hypothetical protein BC829DRAFT_443152 [Chytridium lagenaria]